METGDENVAIDWKTSLSQDLRIEIKQSKNTTFYSMFHVTWTTIKFNRNQLGPVSAYVM